MKLSEKMKKKIKKKQNIDDKHIRITKMIVTMLKNEENVKFVEIGLRLQPFVFSDWRLETATLNVKNTKLL
jgi:hypothetical protein